jgi:hypothetical protein
MYNTNPYSNPGVQSGFDRGFSSSTGGWNSLSVKRTASFSAIQQETFSEVSFAPSASYAPYNPAEQGIFYTRRNSREEEKPDSEATGQLGSNSPVGDMLLPLLTMAVVYAFVKLFRNHKTSHTL